MGVNEIIILSRMERIFISCRHKKKKKKRKYSRGKVLDTDKSIHLAVVSFTTLLRAIVLVKFFLCVCLFSFFSFSPFFFDSRVFTPSRHAQITSRLKSRKIFGKIVFFRYDNNFSPFKVRIFNGLIFISYWYNSIGSFLRSLSERKKK